MKTKVLGSSKIFNWGKLLYTEIYVAIAMVELNVSGFLSSQVCARTLIVS